MRTLISLLFTFVAFAAASLSTFQIVESIYKDSHSQVEKSKRYEPDWDDLDTRPLPKWYDKAKIGIFIHWGVFSVPSFHSEWFWAYINDHKDVSEFMRKYYPPGFTYQEFAPMLTAEFFDPREWASLFARAGAKYVVLTSKHHEGFTMFPSKQSFSWNSVDIGPHRDIVGELNIAVKDFGLEFGVYHSLYEWNNPMYLEDKKNHFSTYTYRDHKLFPDIKQLINDYEPSILWSDGDWEAEHTYWNSTLLLSWLYNDSPVKDHIVVNDRWGRNIPCHHGDFYNCDDRFDPGKLLKHKWENAFTLDLKSWGYRRNMNITDVMTMKNLLYNIINTVSCGGNVLINVGPTKEGTIPLIFQERLLQLGTWLKLNGEAIYDTSPWQYQNDSSNGNVWYTCKKTKYDVLDSTSQKTTVTAIYAIFIGWPVNSILNLKDVTSILHSGIYQVQMLANPSTLNWSIKDGEAIIELPNKATVQSENAWALKFSRKTLS